MALHTVRLSKNKYVTLDSYYRPRLPSPLIVTIIACTLLIGASIYAVHYETRLCPQGKADYYSPGC